MVILENIDIDIDKAILQNIDIDKISNRFKFGISNRANHHCHLNIGCFETWRQVDTRREIYNISSTLSIAGNDQEPQLLQLFLIIPTIFWVSSQILGL